MPLFNIFAVLILTIENPSHKGKLHPGAILYGILTNPILDGILIGTIYNLLPIGLPAMAQKTFNTLGSLTTPLALLSIGASFEGAKAIKKLGPTVAASFCKLMLLDMIFLPLQSNSDSADRSSLLCSLCWAVLPLRHLMSCQKTWDTTVPSPPAVLQQPLCSPLITMTLWIYVLSAGGFLA